MAIPFLVLGLAAVSAYAFWLRRQRVRLVREQEIRGFVFPTEVLQQWQAEHPALGLKEAHLAARALRQFFLVHHRAGGQLIAMPSKAADALWHAFILDTKAYADFCQAAFGAYLHHVTAAKMAVRDADGSATWRTWRLACLEENINPRQATRLPLLYALDAKLGLEGAVLHDPAAFKEPVRSHSCGGGDALVCDGGSDGGGGGDGGGCGGGCGGGD